MTPKGFSSLTALLASLVLAACEGTEISARPEPAPTKGAEAVTVIAAPTGPGAGEPFLATGADGSLLMSWIEPSKDGRHALRFARYSEGAWSQPATIAERSDFFVNWADFPSLVETNRMMIAHWLQKSGEGTYAYDVIFAISKDGGASWADPVVLHDDGVQAEHGFVSLLPDGSGAVDAVWLDGRNMTEAGHGHGTGAMTLRYARIHPDGSVTDRSELDGRVCECCQTGMTRSDAGLVAIYRDRSDEEIRDIGIVRQVGNGWSQPGIVHEDGWKIAACPVNGPQIDAVGSDLVVAWSTGASGTDQVWTVFSEDGGKSFGEPIRTDEGQALGRVDTLMMNEETAIVVWLGREQDTGKVLARVVKRDGTRSPVVTIGRSGPSRAAGFPRIAKAGEKVFAAWTEPGEPSTVHVASIDAEEIR